MRKEEKILSEGEKKRKKASAEGRIKIESGRGTMVVTP